MRLQATVTDTVTEPMLPNVALMGDIIGSSDLPQTSTASADFDVVLKAVNKRFKKTRLSP